MLRLLSDIDVHGPILRGLLRKVPRLDLVRAVDVLPARTPDDQVLAWAAEESRVLLTNDRQTMVGFAYQRVALGEKMPGVIVTAAWQPIGLAIEEIQSIATLVPEELIRDRVLFLPYRR